MDTHKTSCFFLPPFAGHCSILHSMKDGLALCICASFLFLDIFIYKGLKLSFQIRIGKLVFTNGYCFPFITCDIIHY